MDTSIDRFFVKSFELEFKMEESFLSKVANSVLSALSFMKSKKFIHRDIKPSNILINKTGEIKVCDFGISGLLVNSVAFSYKGSDCYMAVILLIILVFISSFFLQLITSQHNQFMLLLKALNSLDFIL